MNLRAYLRIKDYLLNLNIIGLKGNGKYVNVRMISHAFCLKKFDKNLDS